MKVSILIATYNRAPLLHRALQSVLAQDFSDFEVVVIDDCSTDDTQRVVAGFNDIRIRYIRNEKNIGSTSGDVAIIKRFLDEQCHGDYFVYLCDDDYWLPNTLLGRQVALMEANPSLSFVQGGMVHCYPHPVPTAAPNEDYLTYSFLDEDKTELFWGTVYPNGLLPSRQFLRLYAEDFKNRNIVIGATLFRTRPFKAAGIMDRCQGVRWQAGPAILAGAAVLGDVYYIDEPCLMVSVRKTTASHAGTQFDNYVECLNSIDAAFPPSIRDMELDEIRATMMKTALRMFLCNKIGHKMGMFNVHLLGDISDIMVPETRSEQFIGELELRNVRLSDNMRGLIASSDIPIADATVAWWRGRLRDAMVSR